MTENKFIQFFKSAWEYIKKAKVELIILLSSVLLDLISKNLINNAIALGDSVTVIPNFLNFANVHNYNAAFGSAFGLDKVLSPDAVRIFFIVITFIAVVFFGFFMYRNRGGNLVCRIAYALIIGGAIGNLYDRLVLGYVRDFVQIVYFGLTLFGSTSFAVFNIADAALCIGVAFFAVYYIFIYKEPEKVKTEGDVPTNSQENEQETVSVADNETDKIEVKQDDSDDRN